MYGNNKISAQQIKRLIIVEVLAVSSLISTDIAAKYSGHDGIFAILIAGILSYAYAAVILWICRYTKWNFWDYTEKYYGKLCSKIIALLFIIKYFILAIMTIAFFTKLIKIEVIDELNYVFIFAPVLLLALYGAAKGIEARGRLAECLYMVFMIPVILLIIFAIRGVDIYYISPLFVSGISRTLKGAVILFLIFSPAEILLLESSHFSIEDSEDYVIFRKYVFSGITVAIVINIIIFALNVGNLGLNTVLQNDESTVKLMDTVKISGLILEKQGGLYLVFFIMALIVTLTGLFGNIFNLLDVMCGLCHIDNKNVESRNKECSKQNEENVENKNYGNLPYESMKLKRINIIKYVITGLVVTFGVVAVVNENNKFKTVMASGEKRVEIDSREYVDSIFVGVNDGEYEVILSFNNGEKDSDFRNFKMKNIGGLNEAYQKSTDKKIDFSNVQAIILNVDVYKDYQKFYEIVKMLNNEAELSDNVYIYATDEPVERFSDVEGVNLPGKYISDMTDKNLEYGKTTIEDVRKVINKTEETGIISIFNIKNEEIYQDGMIIMNDEGVKGEFKEEMADYIWLANGSEGMYIVLGNGNGNGNGNEFHIDKNSYHISLSTSDNDNIEVRIIYRGMISPINGSTIDENEVNELIKVVIYNNLRTLLEENKCDLINIYKYLSAADRHIYKKYNYDRHRLYEKIKFVIQTDYKLVSTC